MKKLILVLILAICLILVGGCKKEVPVTPSEAAAPEEAATPPTPPEMAETAAPETPAEILSGLRCIGNNTIEATIANTKDTALELTKDIKIMLNGIIVIDPECDKLTLNPGESVYCKDITGHIPIRQGKINTIQLNLAGERITGEVSCS